MDKAEVIKIIKQFQNAIRARGITPLKIILYGSYASGTYQNGSDIDLVIISDDFTGKDYWERIDILAEVVYEIFAPIEAVALTKKEWENGDSIVTRFAGNGEVLFAA